MEKNPTLTVVAAALVGEGGRILLQQRAAGRQMAGLWEFPGGKVEPGERPERALVRELAEELGIAVVEHALAPAVFASAELGERHLLLLLYLCRAWDGEPRPLDAAALRWARPAEMRTMPMPPADVPLVDALERLLAPPRDGEGDRDAERRGGGGPPLRRI
jgi:8-oxo-dGTP diphosphatase